VLAGEIARSGPMPVARFMALALAHPTLGYYQRRDPLGAAGDFVTAPEVSQAFGELLGLWLAQAWRELGAPAPVRVVELGPGRGTLMADLLRATAGVSGFHDALRVHLVETSEPLRARQRARLGDWPVQWHANLDEVPPGALLLVANEFFDALPVHQLIRTEQGWVERCIGLDANGTLAFVPSGEPSAMAAEVPAAEDAPLGSVAEVSPARARLAAKFARRLVADGGVALLIDYGAWADRPTGDTLQAMRAHAPADPLAAPGEADLSTQVDFRALAEAAAEAGAAVYGPVPQGTFLRALGIEARIAVLLSRATPEQRRALRAGLFRLTDPSAMGELFKVLALAAPAAPPPPGFDAPTLTTG